MEPTEDNVTWFKQNAHGADTIRNLDELVQKLALVAHMRNFDFRGVAMSASLWAMTHPAKKNWGRFYAGWFGRQGEQAKRKTVDWSNPI